MADVTSPFGFPYPEPTDLVRDGATDIEALAQAANDQFAAGFQFAGQRIYTSSGLFEKADPLGTGDIGLRAIRVTVVGGGGGSGGTSTAGSGEVSVAGSGGGGGTGRKFITDIAGLAASETITRGAGGTAGAAGNNNGSSGGTSTAFGVDATGGGGGEALGAFSQRLAAIITGANGTATGADEVFSGAPGQPGQIINVGSTGTVTGAPGSSIFGTSLQSDRDTAKPQAGDRPGCGARGSARRAGTTAAAGAAGANGIVIVEVFV